MNRFKGIVLGATASLISLTMAGCTSSSDELRQALAAQPADAQARYDARNPGATLKFFRVKPGMTVAEALPGGGWYSKIIVNYLGGDGEIYGVNYDDHMWARFGFFTPEQIEGQIKSTGEFPQKVSEWTDNGIEAKGFTFETMPESLAGTVDRVLLIRALHNLNRFEEEANSRTTALQAVHKMLKKDGLVGVVQHRAPESASDAWANGSNGYLKQDAVIDMFEQNGFSLVVSSEINANPNDQPAAGDMVWRLPPTLFGAQGDEEQTAKMMAIGESDRMTLLFRKK